MLPNRLLLNLFIYLHEMIVGVLEAHPLSYQHTSEISQSRTMYNVSGGQPESKIPEQKTSGH